MDILALASATARRLGEIGFLIGALGALVLVVALAGRPGSHGLSRLARLVGPLLIAAGFALGIVYVHWI